MNGVNDMSELLDGVPARQQRQDSAVNQLQDLVRVATRLGMYDAANSINKAFELGKFDNIRYGCHCDIENTVSGQPDDCVLNNGDIEDCIYAKQGMRPEQCEYWRPVSI